MAPTSLKDPYDEGLGGFFLKKGSAGQLEGMWAGYDSTNQSIEAGRYSFWPLSPVEVQDMRETDLSEALAVLGEALGQRYIARDELREYVTDSAKRCAYVAKQSDRGTVGAAIGLLLDAESFFRSIPADQVAEVERKFPGLEFQSLGWLKSMAVSDGMAGQGIGTQLTRAVLRRLSDLGATYVVAIGWTDVKGCHIEGILRSLGFSKVGQLESFWERDSIDHDHECPTCGQPCRCSATFFAVRKPNLVRL